MYAVDVIVTHDVMSMPSAYKGFLPPESATAGRVEPRPPDTHLRSGVGNVRPPVATSPKLHFYYCSPP